MAPRGDPGPRGGGPRTSRWGTPDPEGEDQDSEEGARDPKEEPRAPREEPPTRGRPLRVPGAPLSQAALVRRLCAVRAVGAGGDPVPPRRRPGPPRPSAAYLGGRHHSDLLEVVVRHAGCQPRGTAGAGLPPGSRTSAGCASLPGAPASSGAASGCHGAPSRPEVPGGWRGVEGGGWGRGGMGRTGLRDGDPELRVLGGRGVWGSRARELGSPEDSGVGAPGCRRGIRWGARRRPRSAGAGGGGDKPWGPRPRSASARWAPRPP